MTKEFRTPNKTDTNCTNLHELNCYTQSAKFLITDVTDGTGRELFTEDREGNEGA